MKSLFVLSCFLFCMVCGYEGTSIASEGVGLLPEDVGARSEMSSRHKTTTIFIGEDDPNRAVKILNETNSEYAEMGWVLFTITPYVEDEDFEGFFVTYKRALEDF